MLKSISNFKYFEQKLNLISHVFPQLKIAKDGVS